MNSLSKMKRELLKETQRQKVNAWGLDYEKSKKLRAEEQKNYEKYLLLDGLIKANEKGIKNGKSK